MYIESKKMLVVIIVLSLLVLGLGGFIVYGILNKKEEATITVVDGVNLDLSSFYDIGGTMEKIDKALNNEKSIYYGQIYKNKKTKISDIDPKLLIYIGVQSSISEGTSKELLTEKNIKYTLSKMFTSDYKFTPSEFDVGNGIVIKYDANNKMFGYINSNAYVKRTEEYILTNISTELKQEEIKVRRKVYYVVYEENSDGVRISASIYKNADKKTLVGKVGLTNGCINKNELDGKFKSKMDTFIYTFKEEKEHEYRLSKIEKVL